MAAASGVSFVKYVRGLDAALGPGGDPALLYAGLQTAVDRVSSAYSGIFETAVQLLDNLLATCGVCRTLLFVGAGCGQVEYALYTLLRRVVASCPRKYPFVDLKAVITNDGPVESPWVLDITVGDAIEAYGGEETVVVWITPGVDGGRACGGVAAAAARRGCPGFLWFGGVPYDGFDEAELVGAVGKQGLDAAGELQVKLRVIGGSGRPLCDGHFEEWTSLNRLYARFHVDIARELNGWVSFVLRDLEVPVPTVPLPRLEGARLAGLVGRLAREYIATTSKGAAAEREK